MHRFLFLLLLVLMPLQFSWAAVADYCRDSHSAPAGHHGHTGHGHAPVDADDPAGEQHTAQADPTLVNDHCDPCHGHFLALMLPHDQPPSLRPGGPPVTPRCLALAGTPATPPDRPQWAGLA